MKLIDDIKEILTTIRGEKPQFRIGAWGFSQQYPGVIEMTPCGEMLGKTDPYLLANFTSEINPEYAVITYRLYLEFGRPANRDGHDIPDIWHEGYMIVASIARSLVRTKWEAPRRIYRQMGGLQMNTFQEKGTERYAGVNGSVSLQSDLLINFCC